MRFKNFTPPGRAPGGGVLLTLDLPEIEQPSIGGTMVDALQV